MLPDNPELETESEDSTISKEDQESSEQEASDGAEETSEDKEASTAEEDAEGGTSKQDEWVVPGRFRTTEDVVKSYQHLESEFSRRSNELQRLKTERQKSVDPKQDDERFAEAVKNSPAKAVRDIVREEQQESLRATKQIQLENEHVRLLGNKEYVELQPQMAGLAEQFRDLLSPDAQQDPKTLHALFYLAKGIKADEMARKAESKGQQKGERNALKKTKAQIEGSSSSKGNVKRNFEDLSLADMRKELQKGNT